MEKKGKFDYILLETTGLADPGTVFHVHQQMHLHNLTNLLWKQTQPVAIFLKFCDLLFFV